MQYQSLFGNNSEFQLFTMINELLYDTINIIIFLIHTSTYSICFIVRQPKRIHKNR